MTKTFHQGDGPLDQGPDRRDLYAVIQHSPEIQDIIRDGLGDHGDVEDLCHLLLPEIGVDPRSYPEWLDAVSEAVMMWKTNNRECSCGG